jgi:hypothetical protein
MSQQIPSVSLSEIGQIAVTVQDLDRAVALMSEVKESR